jgi:hypothetical protein
LNESKPKKAYEKVNLQAELMQAHGGNTKHILYCLFSNIYTTGKVLDDFKKSIMLILPKKSKSTKCEEYRTLSILTNTSKFLTKIILGRIDKKIDENLAED